MFKNFNIAKKLIVSFIAISILASIAGVICVSIMRNIDTKYSTALVNYGFAQGDIGKLIASVSRVNNSVHDAISYVDQTDQENAVKVFEDYLVKTPEYLTVVNKTLVNDATKQAYQKVQQGWESYSAKAKELVKAGDSSDAVVVARVQKRIVNELDPLYNTLYSNLQELLTLKVNDGNIISDDLTRFAAIAIVTCSVIILVAMVISILLGLFISKGISKPIKECAARLEDLANGDLNSPIPDVRTTDETGVLAAATGTIALNMKQIIEDIVQILEAMGSGDFSVQTKSEGSYIGDFHPLLMAMREINTRLSTTIIQISESADQVSTGSDQVASGSQALSQGATEQASSVEELAATINEISEQVRKNADNAEQASLKVNKVGQGMAVSNEQMHEMIKAMSEISNSSSEIGKIIKTIEDIAFQTNILALNAAVEAARAGAAGKGFAVVADEVRNLASKSADASKNTASLIESSIRAVENGTKIADETAVSLIEAVNGTKEVVELIDKISGASKEQATSIDQVTQGVDQISSVIQTNSATAEESAAASEELSGQAQMLKNLVGQFKVKDISRASIHQSMQQTTYGKEEPSFDMNSNSKY